MPFKAIDSKTNEVILSYSFPESYLLRAAHPNVVCPCCKAKVSARGGVSKKIITHFFHIAKDNEGCAIARKYSGRSSLVHHTLMVQAVKEYLEKIYASMDGYSVDIEHSSPLVPGRIADLAVLDKEGKIIEAHEIQLSRITTAELDERTTSYDRAGVECIWWFGKNCQSQDVLAWARQNFGYSLLPDNEFFPKESELEDFE